VGKKLAVILGAGASFDSVRRSRTVGVDWTWKAPLTKSLFDPSDDQELQQNLRNQRNSNFDEVLSRYPRAWSLTSTLNQRLSNGEQLEAVLRSWRDGEDFIVRQYQQIPLYLQDLLGKVSQYFAPISTDNYDSLVRRLLHSDFEKVAFITLNYDLLLEKSLNTAGDVAPDLMNNMRMEWYVRASPRWLLCKIHGSVNWGRPMLSIPRQGSSSLRRVLDTLESTFVREHDAGEIALISPAPEENIVNNIFHYPSLAVPVDDDYPPVCPREHLDMTKQFLSECHNLLVVGARGKDADLLKLLAESTMKCSNLSVVAGSTEEAEETVGYLSQATNCTQSQPMQFSGGFTRFLDTGAFDTFTSSLD
jgi:hypothetical protein